MTMKLLKLCNCLNCSKQDAQDFLDLTFSLLLNNRVQGLHCFIAKTRQEHVVTDCIWYFNCCSKKVWIPQATHVWGPSYLHGGIKAHTSQHSSQASRQWSTRQPISITSTWRSPLPTQKPTLATHTRAAINTGKQQTVSSLLQVNHVQYWNYVHHKTHPDKE